MKNILVINHDGESLSPINISKSMILIRQGKAIIKNKDPFTIQLREGFTCD